MESIKNQTFPSPSLQEWEERAKASLKGKPLGVLMGTTYENIGLKPLYSPKDEQTVPQYPCGSDLRRGIHPLGYVTHEWKIAQRIKADTPNELKDKLNFAFEKGQTAISFEVTKDLVENLGFSDFYPHFPFAVNTKWLHAEFLTHLINNQYNSSQVTGYIANDPVALSAVQGRFDQNTFKDWLNDIVNANQYYPKLRTVLIDSSPFHNGGANSVQEIGIAAATGVFYLDQLTEAGMDVESALSKMVFQFSIGSQFFTELAKLRAARIVWGRIASLYGAEQQTQRMEIAAETSRFTLTVTDPHVNLLRTANETFAAVLGGVQYLHTAPYDEITGYTALSERIARNIQLILKEETQLKKIIDPAGGSWYIESLTNQLAEEAWAFFQQIDARGGILEVLKSDWLQEQIETVFSKRNHDVQFRKQSIIGTNAYAKVDEALLEPAEKDCAVTWGDFGAASEIQITNIPQRRLSEPYEQLRNRAKQLEANTGAPVVAGMLCLGELKQHKPRLDFMKGFLAAGGIQTIESGPLFCLEEAKRFLNEAQLKWACLCGTNEQYEQMGHELLLALKTEYPNLVFCLAGLPEKEKQEHWRKEGINQFIHVKSNCYETVSAILGSMEVQFNEETKA
ncbi:methylmalonyl-CoA mutase family protein [Neobacillus sp. Marseille-QA0830]